jgi:hypothetical protein
VVTLNLNTALEQINKIAEKLDRSSIYTDVYENELVRENYFQISIFFNGKVEILHNAKPVKEFAFNPEDGRTISLRANQTIDSLFS